MDDIKEFLESLARAVDTLISLEIRRLQEEIREARKEGDKDKIEDVEQAIRDLEEAQIEIGFYYNG